MPADRIVSTEPAAPNRTVAEVPVIPAESLDRTISSAARAVHEWASQTTLRARALHRWADRVSGEREPLATLLAREVGKPIREARAEVERTESILRYYAQAAYDPVGELLPGSDARSQVVVRRVPVGVVAAICPWNFPLAIPAWKLAPALAYGNAVLFKPASAAVGTGQRLVDLSRPDIPEDVLSFAPVRSTVADILVDDPRIGAVSFTGSTVVGRAIVSRVAGRGGAVQAEMGGNNASIVLADADLNHAAETIAGAAMGYAGQKCTATSRILVERAVATQFVDLLASKISDLTVGDPTDDATDVGPLIDQQARDRVRESVQAAKKRSARTIAGRTDLSASGWYYPPTLLEISDPRDPFMQQETFGPAAAVMVVDSPEEAVAVANGTLFGLSAAIFSVDSRVTIGLAERLNAGMTRINGSTTGADFWAPFGGEKDSSYGPREQGREARQFYTHTRTLTIQR